MVNFKRRLSALTPSALSSIKHIQRALTTATQQIQPIPDRHKAILMPRSRHVLDSCCRHCMALGSAAWGRELCRLHAAREQSTIPDTMQRKARRNSCWAVTKEWINGIIRTSGLDNTFLM